MHRAAGAELVCICAIKAFQEIGNEVTLYTHHPVDWSAIASDTGVQVRPDKERIITAMPWPISRFGTPNLDLITAYRALKFVKRESDLVLNTTSPFLMMDADLVYVHYPASLQVVEGNTRDSSVQKRFARVPYYFATLFLEQRCGRFLIANSQFTANAIKSTSGRASRIIYPPMGFEPSEIASTSADRKNQVVLVSRFTRDKRLDLVPWLASQLSEVDFHIVGFSDQSSAGEVDHLKRLIKEFQVGSSVHVTTNASSRAKLDIMLKSKAFLHLRPHEHFGIAVAEAMAAGLIPIVHASGGPAEITPARWQYEEYRDIPVLIKRAMESWSQEMGSNFSSMAERFSRKRFSRELAEFVRANPY